MARTSSAPKTRLDLWYEKSSDNNPRSLSEATGIAPSRLSKIKLMKSAPTRDEAFAIEDATGMFVDARDCPGVINAEPADSGTIQAN